jgi:rhodanese-related sulfurtransferase
MQPTPYDEALVTRARYRDITPEATYRGRGQARVVDVREAHELVATGIIPGAQHVPLGDVLAVARTWQPDEDIILVCRSGARSGRAADALVERGFLRVMNMAGGMIAYAAAQLPIARF